VILPGNSPRSRLFRDGNAGTALPKTTKCNTASLVRIADKHNAYLRILRNVENYINNANVFYYIYNVETISETIEMLLIQKLGRIQDYKN